MKRLTHTPSLAHWVLAAIIATFTLPAHAIPTLGAVIGDAAYNGIIDTGSAEFSITDVDGVDDDVTGILFQELANNAGSNRSFLYDLTDPTNQVTIFPGPASPITSRVLGFDIGTGAWNNGIDPAVIFASGADFGFGLDGPGGVFLSQDTLNPGGLRQMAAYDTEGAVGLVGAFQFALAFEDAPNQGDGDFNDHVLFVTDIAPSTNVNITGTPVPEPAALMLMGLGLIGIGMVGHGKIGRGGGPPSPLS